MAYAADKGHNLKKFPRRFPIRARHRCLRLPVRLTPFGLKIVDCEPPRLLVTYCLRLVSGQAPTGRAFRRTSRVRPSRMGLCDPDFAEPVLSCLVFSVLPCLVLWSFLSCPSCLSCLPCLFFFSSDVVSLVCLFCLRRGAYLLMFMRCWFAFLG